MPFGVVHKKAVLIEVKTAPGQEAALKETGKGVVRMLPPVRQVKRVRKK